MKKILKKIIRCRLERCFNTETVFQMWNLPAEVHAAVAPAAAHQDSHRRQTVQVSPPRMHKSLFATLQPPVSLQMPPDGQALQVQLLLQVLHRRERPARPHSQTQGVETPQDPHLPVLREELHPGNLLGQAHAEAQRQAGEEVQRTPRLGRRRLSRQRRSGWPRRQLGQHRWQRIDGRKPGRPRSADAGQRWLLLVQDGPRHCLRARPRRRIRRRAVCRPHGPATEPAPPRHDGRSSARRHGRPSGRSPQSARSRRLRRSHRQDVVGFQPHPGQHAADGFRRIPHVWIQRILLLRSHRISKASQPGKQKRLLISHGCKQNKFLAPNTLHHNHHSSAMRLG